MEAWVKPLLLLATTCVYLVLGAYVFMCLEQQNVVDTQRELNRQFAGFVANHSRCGVVEDRLRVFLENTIVSAHRNGIVAHGNLVKHVQDIWNLQNAFIFAFEVVTTIGEGVMLPITCEGRLFTMIYAAIGVPLCYLMLSAVGNTCYFMWRKLCRLFSHIRRRSIRVVLGVSCTVVVLYVVLSSLPAIIMSRKEGWDYFSAQYYCVMVLSTVGLGHMTRNRIIDDDVLDWVVKVLAVLYDLLCLSILSVVFKGFQEYRKHMRTQQEEEKKDQEEKCWGGEHADESPPCTQSRKPADAIFELGKIESNELQAHQNSLYPEDCSGNC